MSIAILSAQRSKDPSTKVGACIVSQDKKVLSLGYNGMPVGVDDHLIPWGKDGEELETKYPYVCHAELNAILNSDRNLKNSKIYVTLFPCNECAKAMIQSGIKEVIYLEDKYSDTVSVIASRRLLEMAGIKITPYEGRILAFGFKEKVNV